MNGYILINKKNNHIIQEFVDGNISEIIGTIDNVKSYKPVSLSLYAAKFYHPRYRTGYMAVIGKEICSW